MGTKRKVSLFIPCFVDQFFPQTGMATVKLLEIADCEVHFPVEQTCCGQPAFNSGYRKEAASLAKRFIRVFGDADNVVAPSGSCVAMVRKHYEELDLQGEERKTYEALKTRIYEVSEFLVDVLKITDFGASFPHKVAYHSSCHGYRELGIHDQPVELLHKVEGITLVEPDDRRNCCGFGGTFAVKFPGISSAMGEDKLAAIQATGAEVVTATDDSCLMHLQGMISRKKLPLRTLHYTRILAGGEALL